MSAASPIRVATALVSQRIFAGRLLKDGRGFKEPRYDVTGDVLAAIRDKVGIGNEIEVGLPGTAVEFRIAVLPPFPSPQDASNFRLIVEAVADADSEDSIGSIDVDIPDLGYPRQWLRAAARKALGRDPETNLATTQVSA